MILRFGARVSINSSIDWVAMSVCNRYRGTIVHQGRERRCNDQWLTKGLGFRILGFVSKLSQK